MLGGRSRNVALWFGAISAMLLCALGLVVGQHLRNGIEQRALENAELVAGVIANSIVDQQFALSELLSDHWPPVVRTGWPPRCRDFERLPVDRVTVFGAEDTIVFASDAALIGEARGIDPAIDTAFTGQLTV